MVSLLFRFCLFVILVEPTSDPDTTATPSSWHCQPWKQLTSWSSICFVSSISRSCRCARSDPSGPTPGCPAPLQSCHGITTALIHTTLVVYQSIRVTSYERWCVQFHWSPNCLLKSISKPLTLPKIKDLPREWSCSWPPTGPPFDSCSPGQNGRHFVDDIFKCIFMNDKICILIEISLECVPRGPTDNNSALVSIIHWRRMGDKPLSEPMPMLTGFTDSYIRH